MVAVSSRRIASTLKDLLDKGVSEKVVTNQLAGYLIDHKQLGRTDEILSSLDEILAENGIVSAEVITAHQLGAEAKNAVMTFVKDKTAATKVELKETVNSSVLGGLIIRTPTSELDMSVARQIKRLRSV